MYELTDYNHDLEVDLYFALASILGCIFTFVVAFSQSDSFWGGFLDGIFYASIGFNVGPFILPVIPFVIIYKLVTNKPRKRMPSMKE